MKTRIWLGVRLYVALALAACAVSWAGQAAAAPEYFPIAPTMTDRMVTVTGKDLTIEQVVQVARYGAQVQLSPEAKQRQADVYAMLNQGAAEGIPIYLFNRNPGFLRAQVRFSGDPLSPENRATLEAQALAGYRGGQYTGHGDEIANEDVVRAIMLVVMSQNTFRAASPGLTETLAAMLNKRVTPVMMSRGGTGQAQGPAVGNINAVMVGAGEAYFQGVRMPAAEALQKAGIAPFRPHPSDNALGATNSDVAGMSALLVHDARQLLEWMDLAYAMDLNGMNSSLTPLFLPVQNNRPFPWINWQSKRVLDMLRGSYLFEADDTRLIQDPESLRASYVRQGSTWQKWAALRDDVLIQMNGSDGNPAAVADAKPTDSWELSTPWAMQYYVKAEGGRGKPGFVFSNGNWDPYPLGDTIEGFTISLANSIVAVMLRQERFESTFFTTVKAHEVLGFADDAGGIPPLWNYNHEVYQRIQGLINPVPPEGYSSDPEWVQDLDAETLFKVERAVKAVEESWRLVANDVVSGARWMDVRKKQDPSRQFGAAPTAAVAALRQVLPLAPRQRAWSPTSPARVALQFVKNTPASTFYPAGPPMPATPAAAR
jgi:histidine ammonia-lyase